MSPPYPAFLIQVCFFSILASSETTSTSPHPTELLTIGAFNVQTFGKSKYSNKTIVSHLVDIVIRYDIILIQEIRDASELMIKDFLMDCKSVNPALDMIVSPRLGRTSYKEQYAIMYNTNKLTVLKNTVYPDVEDSFARPPLVAHFRVEFVQPKVIFSVFGVHVDPDKVVTELDEFPDAYDWAVKEGYPRSGLLMGDLNADCNYLSDEKYRNLAINRRKEFKWLVDKTIDTTVSVNTDCAYDRILLLGDFQLSNFTNTSVDDFDKNISNELAKKISDHYPIRTYLTLTKAGALDESSEMDGDDINDKNPANNTKKLSNLLVIMVNNHGTTIGFLIFCGYVIFRRLF